LAREKQKTFYSLAPLLKRSLEGRVIHIIFVLFDVWRTGVVVGERKSRGASREFIYTAAEHDMAKSAV
jgi:hypothetical protein